MATTSSDLELSSPNKDESSMGKDGAFFEPTDPSIHHGSLNNQEVFKKNTDGVDFRTVGWVKATSIFLKIIFAVGVLSIPKTMYTLGAIGGSLSVVAWGIFNTYIGVIQGNFRERHRGCHSIADMAELVGGPIIRELTGLFFIFTYILCAGAGIIGVTTGLNALSGHAACTVWWAFIAAVVIASAASIRKLEGIGWVTYAGFASIYIAVFIVVVGVTQRDRPAAAPQTGDFELGFHLIAYPNFAGGMVASSTIFFSSCATSAFLPVISEMRKPADYRKALYTCMGIVTASYLCFSLVVYKYCGKWVASPSLGSAGHTVKMAAYGVGLLGLFATGCVYIHIAAKYVFVRILRNSRHLQSNTITHWTTWLCCTFGLSALAFIFAEAIPIFNYLNALTGSLCFAPLAMSLPGWLWLYDHPEYRTGTIKEQTMYWLHAALIPLGIFFAVGGTYGVVLEIVQAYRSGVIGMPPVQSKVIVH
ncbi:hypothetical protein FDECE_8823 [Fusarium decemcellulare]|nr:hypothetical protein FDECE_8823 [Fusarium decemcellulare]